MLEETNKLWKLADRRTGMNILICDDERFAAEKIAELVSRSAYILSPNNVLCGCICSKVTELVTDSMRV